MTPNRTAYDITNPMIRETGEAMRTGDFDLFMRHFALPFIMETYEGKQILQSRYEMEMHFRGVREFRAENDIVDSVRENISAEFRGPHKISLIHVSHLYLQDGVVFDRPYPTYSEIKYSAGRWLIHYCQYGVGDLDAFTRALLKYREDRSWVDETRAAMRPATDVQHEGAK